MKCHCHGNVIGAGFCKYDITTAEIDNLCGRRKKKREEGRGEGGGEEGTSGYNDQLEQELDEAYERYLANTKDGMARLGTKMAKRTKKLQRRVISYISHTQSLSGKHNNKIKLEREIKDL